MWARWGSVGREGGDGMNWEVRIDKYTLLRVKQTDSGKLLYYMAQKVQLSAL